MITGSLQIKNGKYYAVINLKDTNGKRKQKWISTEYEVKGNNKRNAEKFLRKCIEEYELKGNIVSSDILFSDYVKHWLEISKMRVDEVTYQGYLTISNAHIIPYFEACRITLDKLKREDIQKYINSMFENGRIDGKGGLSPKSLRTHMIIIRQTLIEAIKSELIISNPSDYVILPKKQRIEPKFYSASQMNELFEAVKNEPLYPLIYTTAIYGLRRSEVLGLKWDSVDFETDTLTIRHTVVKVSETVEKDITKTEASFRSFPLIPEVKTLLLKLKADEAEKRRLFGNEYLDNDYIFKWDNGKPYSTDFISHKFSDLLKKNGLPHIRFHELRHSCASLLIANGFTLKDIQDWLGHSDFKVTANIYAHLDKSRKMSIAQSMSETFGSEMC